MILSNYANKTILAILFIENEIRLEEDAAFSDILHRIRYKLYNILCVLHRNGTITNEDIFHHKNVRDGYINGILQHSRNYERSIFIMAAIQKMLQSFYTSLQ